MTRMRMVEPELLCSQHLLGEHKELHQARGQIKNRHSITGYIQNGLLEIESIISRHRELVEEMERRGMNHKSPLEDVPFLELVPKWQRRAKVSKSESIRDLIERCPKCKERIANH